MGRVPATELMPEFTGYTVDGGRFRLMKKLGAGAYGKVYCSLDTSSPVNKPKFYAIKCLTKPEPGSHNDNLQQREFTLHKLVSGHRNIVTFHEAFCDENFVYVVLDLCVGGDLFSAITEKHLFHNNGRLIKSAFVQLIDAVQHCHDLGVFHRDIKPENVLCSEDARDIRLADFGLSIKTPLCRDFGCGSSYYMSPECIGRENKPENYSTRHNDIWALGVILTNMITSRNPWRYATSEDECFAAFMQDNDFLLHVLPISVGVNRILKSVFTVNPLHRITLPNLRRRILELNAFFIDEPDRPNPPAHVFCVDERIAPALASCEHIEPPKKLNNDVDTDIVLVECSTSSSLFDCISSDEEYLFPSPVVDPEHLRKPHADILSVKNLDDYKIGGKKSTYSYHGSSVRPTTASESSSLPNPRGDKKKKSPHSLRVPSSYPSSVSSGPESKGPITPATYAVEPNISIPDIPEEEGLGTPAHFASDDFIAKTQPKMPLISLKSKKPKSHLFRTAVQRIKGLSGSTSS